MKRSISVILFGLIVCLAVIAGSANNYLRAATSRHTALPVQTQICSIASSSDCALPVHIEKIQLTCVHLSARQQLKRLSESVFGLPANTATSYSIARIIYRSHTLLRSLETYDIGFPFSAFWSSISQPPRLPAARSRAWKDYAC